MMIRHSCDGCVVLGRLPVAQFEDSLGIDPELPESGFHLFGKQGEGNHDDTSSISSRSAAVGQFPQI
jgi:hypothetical protein